MHTCTQPSQSLEGEHACVCVGGCHTQVNNMPLSSRKHPKTYLTSTSDLATPSHHLCFLGIPRIQSLCSSNNMEEMESKVRTEKVLAAQAPGLNEHRTASFHAGIGWAFGKCSAKNKFCSALTLNSHMVCIIPKLDPKETSWRKHLVGGTSSAGFPWPRLEGPSLFQ